MYKLILTPFLTLFLQTISSQIGIYLTYEDYLNNNLEESEGLKSTTMIFGKYNIAFIDSNKMKINHNNLWGYKTDQGTYRISEADKPYYVSERAEIWIYEGVFSNSDYGGGSDNNPILSKISEHGDGNMVVFSKREL